MRVCHRKARKKRSCRTSKYDLDVVGIEESWEKGGAGIGCDVGVYACIKGERNRQKNEKRVA